MDNASSNDTQTTKLAALPNLFEVHNRVQCFNHTIQLAAKALLRPLNPGITGNDDDDGSDTDDGSDCPPLVVEDESDEEGEEENPIDAAIADVQDDGIDELEDLEMPLHEEMITETVIVREAVSKVCWIRYNMITHSDIVSYRCVHCRLPLFARQQRFFQSGDTTAQRLGSNPTLFHVTLSHAGTLRAICWSSW